MTVNPISAILPAIGIAAQAAFVAWLLVCTVCVIANAYVMCGGTLGARLTRIERNLESIALEPWYSGKRLWFHGASLVNSVFNR